MTNKVKISNSAHKRLENKAAKSHSDYDNFVKRNYHYQVANIQAQKNRILSDKEKRDIYRSTEWYFLN